MWDFGDGTTVGTRDNSTTHTFKESGVYTITLKVQNNTGEKIIQTYLVTVTENTSSYIDQLTDPKAIASIASAIIAAVGVYLAYLTHKRGHPAQPPPIEEKETKTHNDTVNT